MGNIKKLAMLLIILFSKSKNIIKLPVKYRASTKSDIHLYVGITCVHCTYESLHFTRIFNTSNWFNQQFNEFNTVYMYIIQLYIN